ncbi:MAG: WecB/TagA/CpsF family glycosyltransferase [Actinomycetota bacterium]|nr:WecB/TagA/CpsF family glycosyltransferase [Actinomycetota bacterium]
MERPFPTIEVLGVPVAKLTPSDALAQIDRIHDEQTPALVAYANAHTLNLATTDPSYREVLQAAAIVLNDGAGIGLAARVQGERFPANLNGSDFNPQILGLAADRRWPVYFVGARPGVAVRAAAAMTQRYPNLVVAGHRDGYWSPEQERQVVADIQATGATLIMAALGNPLQEKWLAQHLPATGARIGVGVGAFFDFAAGEVPRAPAWMNRWGIEWIFRLAQEPTRLWKRYVLGNPLFLARALRARLKPH